MTDTNVFIRPAGKADLAALGRLGALLMRTHHDFDRHRFLTPGDDAESGYGWFLETRLADPDSLVLVAVRREQVVGYVYASVEPLSWKELRDEAGFIHDVAVEPDERRSGVATALMAGAVDWARKRGMPRVLLWTAEQNAGAQRAFAGLGFRRTMVEMTLELGGGTGD